MIELFLIMMSVAIVAFAVAVSALVFLFGNAEREMDRWYGSDWREHE